MLDHEEAFSVHGVHFHVPMELPEQALPAEVRAHVTSPCLQFFSLMVGMSIPTIEKAVLQHILKDPESLLRPPQVVLPSVTSEKFMVSFPTSMFLLRLTI